MTSLPIAVLELLRIEPIGPEPDQYVATFQAQSPEGQFQVKIQFKAEDEAQIFRLARHNMRKMLARLAGLTADWSITNGRPSYDPPATTRVLTPVS